MKAFLEHDRNGLFYHEDGFWVSCPARALAFATFEEAEAFRATKHIEVAHAVCRIDPDLTARLHSPGVFQRGE
jgi:hypothetical protein